MTDPASDISDARSGRLSEVFRAFLKLGCMAFGGPIAHLGFFRNEFVERRRWLDDATYADLVALCQFLPGPASSQVGIALGWRRAGYFGALMAWLGFTLPSAVFMLAFAYGIAAVSDVAQAGWVKGLEVAAVAVVAQALWQMAGRLCPDARRATIAAATAIVLLVWPQSWMQIVVLVLGATAGLLWLKTGDDAKAAPTVSARAGRGGWGWLALFGVLLVALPAATSLWPNQTLATVDGFYRAGSLVFGGGHVVLPLLEQTTVGRGWLDHDTFLAGYGAAQAVPGPLFSFSTYLGAVQQTSPRGVVGGMIALASIYLPSALLIFGALPHWERLRRLPSARSLIAGTNAAVVGLLGAAFYHPVWTSAITGPDRLAVGLGAFAALRFWSVPPWLVVLGSALVGQLMFSG